MKIFSSSQIHELDKYTMEHEPIRSIDLTERAAKALTRAIVERLGNRSRVVVFAGPGNNGADALAVARMLAEQDYQVRAYLFNISDHLSEDCTTNRQRVIDCKKMKEFVEVNTQFDPPLLEDDVVVIDGLFGSGLNKPLAGGFASLVKYVNQSPSKVISIDMPSGLMAEDNTYNISANIIQADVTLTLQQKKLAFMFADNQPYIGELQVLDIRLSQDFINRTETQYAILEEKDIRARLKERDDFAHKGTMGHALIIAGSYGMAGASILATRACLRSGVGKLTVHTPRRNYTVMQVAAPEAIMQVDHEETYFSEAVNVDDYDAVGIGPGLGQQESTAIAFISQLRRTNCPVVVDADGLNILSKHRAWMQQLPKGIIMTPHPKEFERMAGTACNGDYERLLKAQDMAQQQQTYILLKGHYSALCLPSGRVIFNSTGNSGMATAGSGDVLTGIITGLLARGYRQADACAVGMYLHGLAGDLAAREVGKESLVAGDIINYLPQAFRQLNG